MERLTEHFMNTIRLKGSKILYAKNLNLKRASVSSAIVRLAAYEDTDLSPEEIMEFLEDIESRFILWVNKKYGIPAGKFLDIMQANKDGRLVVLPCKPEGDAK